MAEIGIPRIAASTSAAMYALERITATGSTAGGPLPVFRQTALPGQRLGLLEDCGVAGERVDILGDPVTALVVGRDRRTAHHEDRGRDASPPEPGVELVEQVGGLLGGELMPTARHAVTRSRAGT